MEVSMEVLNWATLGSRILELTQQAVEMQREEEGGMERRPGVPFLRLVKPPEWEMDAMETRESGSAA
jgi:hypothetical protein